MANNAILKYMETEECKKRLEKWDQELITKEKIEEEKIKKMFSDTEYISWLNEFTIKHSEFSDNTWLYFPEKISENDREHVNDLHLLFEGIEEYANRNYLFPTPNEWGEYYSIKYNNIGFNIGVAFGQGTLFYCERTDAFEKAIEFEDILNNKSFERITIINNKFEDLSQKIIELIELGIPIQVIQEKIGNIETEEKGKVLERHSKIN